MNIKYKYIDYQFLEEDEKVEQFLENQARKGWMLNKIGTSFFKFKKIEPKELRFFIDYQRASDDYIYHLEQCGYHYIDNYRILNILYSEDLHIEPIQSDPVVKAISHKELYKPWSIILLFILGLFIFNIVDVFNLSAIFFRTIDHIILYFNNYLFYLLVKLFGLYLIFESIIMLIWRIKYNREIKGLTTPKCLTQFFIYFHKVFSIILTLLTTLLIILDSINDPAIILSIISILIIMEIYSHYIHKEIVKIESKPKRVMFSILAFILFVGCYQLISDFFSNQLISSQNSTAYQSDVYNFSQTTTTLFYVEDYKYGTLDKKNEFDEYIQTYSETVYNCRNEWIAKSIFRCLVRDASYQKRMPSDEEIEKITNEKGSFNSYEDVPFYSYQKSLNDLTHYEIKNTDICCGYDHHFIAIKDHVVYDFLLKDNTDIQKLVQFYR